MTQELEFYPEILTEKLREFWGTLSDEHRKAIWMNVAYIISSIWSSENLMEIIRWAVISRIPENTEFNAVMDIYSTLDIHTQWVLRNELSTYFLKRNL